MIILNSNDLFNEICLFIVIIIYVEGINCISSIFNLYLKLAVLYVILHFEKKLIDISIL